MALDRSDFALLLGGHGFDLSSNRNHATAVNGGSPTKTRDDGDHCYTLDAGPILEVDAAELASVWGASSGWTLIIVGELIADATGEFLAIVREADAGSEVGYFAFPSNRPSFAIRTSVGLFSAAGGTGEVTITAGERYVAAITFDGSSTGYGYHGDDSGVIAETLISDEISGDFAATTFLTIAGRRTGVGTYDSPARVRHLAAGVATRPLTEAEIAEFANRAAGTGGTLLRGPRPNEWTDSSYAADPTVAPASRRIEAANLERAQAIISSARVDHVRIECVGGDLTPTYSPWDPAGDAPRVLDLLREAVGRSVGLSGLPMIAPIFGAQGAGTLDARRFPCSELAADAATWELLDADTYPSSVLGAASVDTGARQDGAGPASLDSLAEALRGAADDREVDSDVFDGDPAFPIGSPWRHLRSKELGTIAILSTEVVAASNPGDYRILGGDEGTELTIASGEWTVALDFGVDGNALTSAGSVDSDGLNSVPSVAITYAELPEGYRRRFAISAEVGADGLGILGIAALPPAGVTGASVGGFCSLPGATLAELSADESKELRSKWLGALPVDLLVGEFVGVADAPAVGPDEITARTVALWEESISYAGGAPFVAILPPLDATDTDRAAVQARAYDELSEWALAEGHGLIRLDAILAPESMDGEKLGAGAVVELLSWFDRKLCPAFGWRYSLGSGVSTRNLGRVLPRARSFTSDRPVAANLVAHRALIASGAYRLIVDADSLGLESSVARALWEGWLRTGHLDAITAHCLCPQGPGGGLTRGFDFTISEVWDQSGDPGPQRWRVDPGTHDEQVGLPQGFGRLPVAGQGTSSKGSLYGVQILDWPSVGSWATEGASLLWANVGVRPTFWWLEEKQSDYALFDLRDKRGLGGILTGATGIDPSAAARKRWSDGDDPSLGVAGAPVAGRLNALATDYAFADNAGVLGFGWCAPASATLPTPSPTEYFIFGPPVLFQADGAGSSAWVGGAELHVRSGSSWASWGFSEGAAQAADSDEAAKTVLHAQTLAELDVTQLSRTNRALYLFSWDYTEHNHAGSGTPTNAPAPMTQSADWDLVLDHYMARVDAEQAALGMPPPLVLLVACYYLEEGGDLILVPPGVPAADRDEALSIMDMQADAMYRASTRYGDRVGFVSLLELFGRMLPGDASGGWAAHAASLGLDRKYVGPSVGTIDFASMDESDLMNVDRMHLADPGALLAGLFIRDAIEAH
jgi:hypothetical protein